MEATPTAANAEVYGNLLHKERLNAQAAQIASQLARDLQAGGSKEGSLSRAVTQLEALQQQNRAPLITSEEAMITCVNDLQEMSDGKGAEPVSTGISYLDWMLDGGMIRQGLYILGARPGTGKTALGLSVAEHAANLGPVLFLSLEMPVQQLSQRRIAASTGVALGVMKNRTALERSGKWEQIALGAMKLSEKPLYFNFLPTASVEDLGTLARSIQGLRLVVVDYLGLFLCPIRNQYEKITCISNDLKRMARTLNVPILCLAQLNRASTQRPNEEPRMADLRDSGAIEQDADAILLLSRPDKWAEPPEVPIPVRAALVKNRHGRIGRFELEFDGPHCRFLQPPVRH